MVFLTPAAYKALLRPLLFLLPAEAAQKASHLALRQRYVWRAAAPFLRVRDERLAVQWCGHSLANPVGLAAGFDKTCGLLPSLAALGFGYLMCGTVTEEPRPGNPKPRLFRHVREQSLVNAMGFPNKGLEATARRLEHSERNSDATPVVVSVSGVTAEEMVTCHRRLEPLVDAVELNISSPNAAGLRVFHEPAALRELIGRVNESRSKPLMVKLPPYPSPNGAQPGEQAREGALALANVCLTEGVDAVTVANSRPVTDARLSTGAGGLSGVPIFEDMIRMVADVRSEVGDTLAINACGGIFTGRDAWRALRAGATTVQLYTGLVYCGPGVVWAINRELLAITAKERPPSPSSAAP